MKTVNMHEAKTHLSRLVEAATKGEPFVIARAGKPLVKVIPVEEASEPKPRKSRIGFLEGQFRVPDDFDTMMADEIRDLFEGKEDGSGLWRPREEDERASASNGDSDETAA